MLAKRFEDILHKLGMAGLEHPLFYHAPVGIRFEIGGEEPIYLDRNLSGQECSEAENQPRLCSGCAGPGRRDLSGTSGDAGPSADRRVSR